jgi:hypothetical protein
MRKEIIPLVTLLHKIPRSPAWREEFTTWGRLGEFNPGLRLKSQYQVHQGET